RPRALERPGELAQRAIVAARRALAEELVGRLRSAIAEPVGTEGVAREEDRARWWGDGTAQRRRFADRPDGRTDAHCRAGGRGGDLHQLNPPGNRGPQASAPP